MVIAHKMGKQGIVSSLCPIHVAEQGTGDPLYGYRPAVNTIVNRLKVALTNTCLSQKLQPTTNVPTTDPSFMTVPCLLLVTLSDANGNCKNPPASACDAALGLKPVAQTALLGRFCDAAESQYKGAAGGPADPAVHSVCELNQLVNTPQGNAGAFDSTGSCSNPPDHASKGWCYVEGTAAGKCPQAILFTANEPPHGATVSIQCIEQSNDFLSDAGGGGSSASGD
jgi:hypothetical protein